MDFTFFVPTRVIVGRNCVRKEGSRLTDIGKKALITTGRSSSRKNGSLDDILAACRDNGIESTVYDAIRPNPSTSNVQEAGELARREDVDFVIGIGGGSPMDGAKAAAVLATNEIDPEKLFDANFENRPLPVVAVPTTAGTGSEVTPYSVISSPKRETKKGFGADSMFPTVSYLDGRYMEDLPADITVDTMLDALSHAVEGCFSPRGHILSDELALHAIETICSGVRESPSFPENIDLDLRDKLLYGSMLAGMVIAHSGTTILHGMGYHLTYFDGIPHGRANGLLMVEYLRLCRKYNPEKTGQVLEAMGVKRPSDLIEIIEKLFASCEIDLSAFDREKLEDYTARVMETSKPDNTLGPVTAGDIREIYIRSLL